MAKWLLIDGFNLAYRCFHALPELTRTDGFPTGALHGWVKSLWKLVDLERPDSTLVFFDLGESAERVALHAAYKAQREPMPDALRRQIDPIKALIWSAVLNGVIVVPMSATTITRKLRLPSMCGTTVCEPTSVHFG